MANQNNQQMYNNGYQYAPNGYGYGMPRPMAKNTQPLTQEEIARLRRTNDDLSLTIPEEDLLKCACTHKESNGANALMANPDGTFTCSICKATFKPFDGNIDGDGGVKEAVNYLISMLQTAKMIYLDAPDDLVRQYFQVIPLLEKFPKLWEIASNNFSKYEGYDGNPINNYGGFGSGFVAMNQLLTNPYAGYMMQPNANYQYPQQQYQYGQQPQAPVQSGQYMAPQQQYQYGQPQAPAMQNGYMPTQYAQQPQAMAPVQGQYVDPNNPMAYGVPTQAPQAPNPGVMPQAPATDSAQQQNNEVQQQKTFNV